MCETKLSYFHDNCIVLFQMKLCYSNKNQIIKIKVSWRVSRLSSTANPLPAPLISTCTAGLVSIKDVLVNFVNAWVLKEMAVSHKTVRLCVRGAARGSKPVFVWIKMKGFESRRFLLSVTTFNSAEGVDWRESGAGGKKQRSDKLRLSDFWI